MRQFLAFIHKEMLYIMRDQRTLLILIAMPVVQVLLFGFALNTEVNNVRIVVLDLSHDVLTHRITENLAHNPYFQLESSVTDRVLFEQLLRQGKVDVGVIFPASFQSDLLTQKRPSLQLILDASNPNQSAIVEGYVQAVVLQSLPRVPNKQAIPYTLDVENRMLFNPQVKSTYNFVPGVMGMVLIIICSIMTSVSIVREKEYGSLSVLRVSPFSPLAMVVAKVIPYALVSLVNFLSILALAYYVLHVPLRGSFGLLLAVSIVYILLGLSVGMCASTMVKTQSNAIIITGIGMLMPTLLLSGMLFPIRSMFDILQKVSYVVPARWYITAVRKIMIQGVGFQGVWVEFLILLLMTISILSVTIGILNKETE